MLSCVASAGLFFRVREEISRMREGRKEEEPSASRVSLAWPLKKKLPAPAQCILDMTACNRVNYQYTDLFLGRTILGTSSNCLCGHPQNLLEESLTLFLPETHVTACVETRSLYHL